MRRINSLMATAAGGAIGYVLVRLGADPIIMLITMMMVPAIVEKTVVSTGVLLAHIVVGVIFIRMIADWTTVVIIYAIIGSILTTIWTWQERTYTGGETIKSFAAGVIFWPFASVFAITEFLENTYEWRRNS